MPKSNAVKQREYRRRLAERHAGAGRLAAALDAENARLTVDLAAVRADLEDARAECERLRGPACRHPAGVVVDGVCRSCGAELY